MAGAPSLSFGVLLAQALFFLVGTPHRVFDEAFRPDNLAIGRPLEMVRTPFRQYLSFDRTHPYYALVIPPEHQHLDAGAALYRYGPRAFVGLTGVAQRPRRCGFALD